MNYKIIIVILIVIVIMLYIIKRALAVTVIKRKPCRTTHFKLRSDFEDVLKKQEYLNRLKKYKAEENPPEYIKLHKLLNDFKQNQSWDNIIAMGDMYKNGSYPRFKNNKQLAMECYKTAARCPDGNIAGVAQLKYIETRNDNINEIDNIGKELPCSFGIEICNLAINIANNTQLSSFNRPKSQIHHTLPLTVLPLPVLPLQVNFDQNQLVYRNDTQNVHDHGVTNILKSNIKKLNENKKKDDDDDDHDNIINIIDSIITHPELSESVKANALTVIDNLNSTEKHSSYDITERDALTLVWNKINKNPDNIEILAKQLDSGIENGNIVCSTGKIARIIGTLDGIDSDITLSKPLWVIRDEIGSLAGKIMNSNVENPKQEFENSVINIYIKDLNMNKSIIQPIIDEYSQHI